MAAMVFTGTIVACNNSNGNNAESKAVDSLKERKDKLFKTVDSTFDAKKDSLTNKEEQLKQKFDSTYNKKFDSVKS
ncbi:MAG: hypothetical protein ICV65_14715 [Flavisolibacter sp.]|nr:hypothetical protein [Flavisolibacter sp.]